MKLALRQSQFLTPRVILLGLSTVSLVLCALGATAHYLKWAFGNPWHLVGWLLGMVFLLLAFLPGASELRANFKSVIKPKTAFFVFWILFFVVAHLWNFRTAPWNGNGIFDDAADDLLFLKTHATGRPFQAAWFQDYGYIAHETLFHYYLWPWLHLFGSNILTDEAASLALWCTTFLFTLLLADLFFESYVVTSVIALVFTFLPFAFIYSFFAFHYEMAAPLCVASLYFLHVGFKTDSFFCLALGGIAAGLCLASSLLGEQYVLALLVFVVLYAVFNRKRLKQGFNWRPVLTVIYGFAVAAMPILAYIIFNRHDYAYHQSPYLDHFLQAVRGHPSPDDLTHYLSHLWISFFTIPGPRLFFPDALPIPLPYYLLLLPGFVLALWQERFEIVLLATIPVVGVFVALGSSVEHRLLVAIPFWILLIGFGLNSVTQLRLPLSFKILLWGVSAALLLTGLVPAIQYIYTKAKNPSSIRWFQEVAVARFLKAIVAGKAPPTVPRLEHDEFNRIQGIPDPPYETLICQNDAYWGLHMFLHDYDDQKILSFCDGHPMMVMSGQDIWSDNKKAIANYVPNGKDLKLIWETGAQKNESIIRMFQSLRNFGTEDSLSFSFDGRVRTFYVLNIPNSNLRAFQERVRNLSELLDPTAKPTPPPPPLPISGEWTRCASEMQQCNFSGTKQVRFGANDIYYYGTFTGGVLCANSIFGDPITGVIKHCDYADIVWTRPKPTQTPATDGWTHCANETEQCNFSGTKQVRYGANDAYNYGIFTDGVVCANSMFGDPISGVIKHCDYADIIQATPTPARPLSYGDSISTSQTERK